LCFSLAAEKKIFGILSVKQDLEEREREKKKNGFQLVFVK